MAYIKLLMNKYLFLLSIFFLTTAQAENTKVIYDCSSSKSGYIKTRMWLVGKTIEMMEKDGDTTDYGYLHLLIKK